MNTYLDCAACFVRQALDATRMVTDDPAIHERVLRNVLRAASEMDLRRPPLEMGQRIHRMIRELTGNRDPYSEIKKHFNRWALQLYPELKERVENSGDPFETAVRLAMAGNSIDFGVTGRVEDSTVHEAIEHACRAPLPADLLKEFKAAVERARSILYLGDSAGEIVFDRLLVEQIPREKVTFVVKGSPVINDATMEDARAAGLCDLVDVIDNGSDAPGTLLDDCSREFRRRFDAAEVIVAKGQGNYESLNHLARDIFFLLKVKCSVIAEHLRCSVGAIVLRKETGALEEIPDKK